MNGSNSNQRRGAAAVEFAMVLPVLFLLFLGMLEFGRTMTASQIASNAVRRGARQAVIPGTTNTEIVQIVSQACQDSLAIDATDVTVTISVIEANGNPPAGNEVANANFGDACKIEVEIGFDSISYFTPQWMVNVPVYAQATLEHE